MRKDFTIKQKKELEKILTRIPTILPFSDDTPEKKAKRIKKVTGNGFDALAYFCKTYFPDIFELPFCDEHKEGFDEIERNIGGVTAITGFREFGKTVLFGLAFSIWKIALDKCAYLRFTCATIEELAEKKTKFVHIHLTENKRLLNDFPEIRVIEGDEKSFYTKSKCLVEALSIESAHRGGINPKNAKRVTINVCDDIDLDRNQGNQSIGKRKMDRILQEIKGSLSATEPSYCIWLGNLTHPNFAVCQFEDLLIEEIKSDEPNSKPENRKHLKSWGKTLLKFPLEDKNGNSVWEAKFPTQKLPEVRRAYGHTGYQREMLGKKMIEGNIFKNEWFIHWGRLNVRPIRVWMYADPAWGRKGCFRAITVCLYDGTYYDFTKVWVRQTTNSNFYEAYHLIYTEHAKKYGVRFRAAMEANYGQTRHWQEFDRWCEEHGKQKISHLIKKIYQKENKNLRIEETETSIESGKVRFPTGQDMDTLKSQFLTYPQGYIDGPDCVAGNLRLFREYIHRNNVRVRNCRY